MRDLLLAVQSRLQSQLTADVRALDIFFTENEDWVPKTVKYPAIGIKDGGIDFDWETSKKYKQILSVRLIVWVSIKKLQESLIGANGVLVLTGNVINALVNQKLGISGVYRAFPTSIGESETFGQESDMVQKQVTIFEYRQECTL